MWLPQKFFAFSNGDPNQGRADYILKVETLQEDMDKLLSDFNLKTRDVHHVNASKNTLQNINYQDYYTNDTKDFVYNMEKPLIKEFKYEF